MKTLRIWLIASLVAFVCCMLSAILLVTFSRRIAQFGLNRSLYFIILVVVSLLAAGFLFGALRSYGRYQGKFLSGTLELSGPVVVSCLIILLGLRYAAPTTTFNLVVRPHSSSVLTDALRTGNVTLYIGSSPRTEPIGNNGQAQFNEIPSSFEGGQIDFRVDIPGYVAVTTSPLTVPETGIAYIRMIAERTDSILSGSFVSDRGRPVRNASLVVNQGLAFGSTNERGEFLIHVPLKEGTLVNLKATFRGATGFDNTVPVAATLQLTFSIANSGG